MRQTTTAILCTALLAGAAGCQSIGYQGGWHPPPEPRGGRAEDGMSLRILDVQPDDGLRVRLEATLTARTRIRSVRLSHRGAPPCHAPVHDPDFDASPPPEGGTVPIEATFSMEDARTLGVMDDGGGVAEVEVIDARGARSCLRAPFVLDPRRTEWKAVEPPAQLGAGVEFNGGVLDAAWNLWGGAAARTGPLWLWLRAGVGSAAVDYVDPDRRELARLRTPALRLAPGAAHVVRFGNGFGLGVQVQYDLFWITDAEVAGVVRIGGLRQGPRVAFRLLALPHLLGWPGFEQPAYRGAFAVELFGGWWFETGPFRRTFVGGVGVAWEMGVGGGP